MSPGGRAGGGESLAPETASADSSGNWDTTEAAHLQICRFPKNSEAPTLQCLICMKIKICLQLDSATSLHTRASAHTGEGREGLGEPAVWGAFPLGHPLSARVPGRGREHTRHCLPSPERCHPGGQPGVSTTVGTSPSRVCFPASEGLILPLGNGFSL